MSRTLDADVKSMSHAERGREIMRLRALIQNVVVSQDNAACWVHERELAAAVGLCPGTVRLDEATFLVNCRGYHRRKAVNGLVTLKANTR